MTAVKVTVTPERQYEVIVPASENPILDFNRGERAANRFRLSELNGSWRGRPWCLSTVWEGDDRGVYRALMWFPVPVGAPVRVGRVARVAR